MIKRNSFVTTQALSGEARQRKAIGVSAVHFIEQAVAQAVAQAELHSERIRVHRRHQGLRQRQLFADFESLLKLRLSLFFF